MVRDRTSVARIGAAVAALSVTAAALVCGVVPAAASTTISTKTLLAGLTVSGEHRGGFTPSKFGGWGDADGDGCNTHQEVLLAYAKDQPTTDAQCTLTGGRWVSTWDGVTVTDAAQLAVDHLVPLSEAWQSNAWRWDSDTRHRFMNDLGYRRTLVPVTSSVSDARNGQAVPAWLPPATSFDCTYLAWWVGVKWRWRLSVDANERSFLADHLASCGWPRIVRPVRAKVVYATVVFSFVGDTILGSTPELPDDPDAYVRPVVGTVRNGVDVGFANLEGTFTKVSTGECGTSSGSGCFQFRNPPWYAHVFARAGYDVLNLANNHSHDFGATGLHDTETAIRNAGMKYDGLPGQITYVKSNGVRVAFVGFAPYGDSNNLLDLTKAAQLIRTARANAPIVVVYMHAGAEGADADHVTGHEEYFVGEDRGNPRRFAHMAVDNGASLVVASGPHVMRGMEFYRHRLIAYSLGDFANFHNFNTTGVLGHSAVLRVTLSRAGGFRSARLVSVSLDSGGHATVGGGSVAFVRSLSDDDFGSNAARLSSSGVITQP